MRFKEHYNLRDTNSHAFLGASKYHWTNYDVDKLVNTYKRYQAAQRGTELHNLAEQLIRFRIKVQDINLAFNMFVNDAIGYRMQPEQPLFYSENSFGTADAISFRDNHLRIHDLKTGTTRVSMRQLEVYAALFCLEYSIEPNTITMELRVYQGDAIHIHEPEPSDIFKIMDTIIEFDEVIQQLKNEME